MITHSISKTLLLFLCIMISSVPATADTHSGTTRLPAGAEAYVPILKNMQHILANGLEGRERRDGERGVMEAMTGQKGAEALRSVGWLVRDLSGDGIPELLIGAVSQDADGKFRGTDIFALYTLKEGKPFLTLEGTLRNAFALMDNGNFFHTGSGGGMRRIFAILSLTPDATALTCHDFWFSHEKAGPAWEMGFFHNTTGEMDISLSEEVDENVFTERTNAIQQACRIAEFTPFTQAILHENPSPPAGQNTEVRITSRFGFGNVLMGGWSPELGWLNARTLQKDTRFHNFRIWGGESCRVFGMRDILEEHAVISAIHSEHPGAFPAAQKTVPGFDIHSAAGTISPPSAVLTILCDWAVQPRKPILMQNSNTIYQGITEQYLASRGLHTVGAQIVQLCRIDLEGDGVDEVLVCAQNIVKEGQDISWLPDRPLATGKAIPASATKGMYSILLLRKIVAGKVMQLPLHEYVVDKSTALPPILGRLYLFADLNGDGVMEIITGTTSHTNTVYHVFEVQKGKITEILSRSTTE